MRYPGLWDGLALDIFLFGVKMIRHCNTIRLSRSFSRSFYGSVGPKECMSWSWTMYWSRSWFNSKIRTENFSEEAMFW